MRILSPGHAAFAVVMIGVGILGLVTGGFTSVWQGAPKSLPMRELLIYACAAVSLAGGLGLLFKPTAGFAARVLFAYLLVWMLVFKVPFIFRAPLEEGSYQSSGENAVIVAGAWVLYTWLASAWEKRRLGFLVGDLGLRLARSLYALALIAFGFSHFVYLDLTAPIVPDWLPWHVGWAYFTGGAYIAAGLAILVGILPRLAAALSTAQMAGFLLLIWVPLVASGQASEFRFGEFVATCVLTAAGWVVTDSYREAPWFKLMTRAAQT